MKGAFMKFVMFVCTDPSAEKYDPALDNIEEWVSAMDKSGKRVMGQRLAGVEEALTVRKRKGKVIVTRGPFAETTEWIAGFDILECASMEEAAEVAAQHPMARLGKIELRPFCKPIDRCATGEGT
jgi:hypothetical protein